MSTQRKIDIVKNLSEKLNQAKSIVLTDYRGLTHKQIEEIKKTLKKLEAEFIVIKNSLLVKAFSDSSLKNFQDKLKTNLNGPTAVILSKDDEIAPLKVLMKIIKTYSLPKIKSGFLGFSEISAEDVMKLVKIPSKNILLAQLANQMKAPVYGLHRSLSWNLNKLVWTLNAVRAKRTT